MREQWITDWEPSPRWPVYTRGNAGEVLSDPCSPLGWSLVWEEAILPGWRDAYVTCGVMLSGELDDERPEMVGHFGGYLYVNLSNMRTWASRLPGSSVEDVDNAIVGPRSDLPAYEPHPDDQAPEALESAGEGMQRALSLGEWPGLADRTKEVDRVREARPDLSAATSEELVARIRDVLPLVQVTFEDNAACGVWSTLGPGMLGAVGAALGEEDRTVELISGLGDVDSALPSYATWRLSRMVAGSTELTEAFDAGVDDVLDRLAGSSSDAVVEFRDAFDEFVRQFGSRGPSEWDIAAQTWETNPRLALRHIDRVRFASDEVDPSTRLEQVRATRERLSAELVEKASANEELSGMLAAGLQASKVYFVSRERAKTNCIKALHEIRVAVRELGRRAAEAGHLDDAHHVMMLTADELDAFVEDPGAFGDVLGERAAGYRELFELDPPYFIDGDVPPLDQWSRRGSGGPVDAARSGEVLRGLAGSPGTARGRARLVLDPSGDSELEPGDILVAPTTDPSWTPLFLAAGAVVVDTGAISSHAVIVSRELGIPCVPSVESATSRIQDGADITVDGVAGTVTVH